MNRLKQTSKEKFTDLIEKSDQAVANGIYDIYSKIKEDLYDDVENMGKGGDGNIGSEGNDQI